ncbi:MAG: glycosyltransferase [Candidatus Polarisedimenticolia bacterium]
MSLCLIVRDEAERIGRCLDAALPIADEIVVVDTGSTDGTAAIAAAKGARVVPFVWIDDFAAARNAALDAARGDWILMLDADEVLERPRRERLRKLLAEAREPAFTVEIVSPRGAGRVETARIARLFRRDPRHRYEGRIHESVLGSICRALGRETISPEASGLRARHEGYAPELAAARGKEERNRRLLLAEIEDKPDDPGPRVLFARENTPAAGGDVLDLPLARQALAIVAPAADELLRREGWAIVEPAAALAARLASACGQSERASEWLVALRRRAPSSARGAYAAGESAFVGAAAIQVGGEATRPTGEATQPIGEADAAAARPTGAADAPRGAREELFAAAAAEFRRARQGRDLCTSAPSERELRDEWAPAREALARLFSGEPAAAERLAHRAGVEPRLVEATLAARRDEPAAALDAALGAVKAEAQDPRGWLALALVFAALGETARSAEAADKALAAAPGWSAAEAVRAGDIDDARLPVPLAALRLALRTAPPRP